MKKRYLFFVSAILILKILLLVHTYSVSPMRFFYPDSMTYIRPALEMKANMRFFQHGNPEIFRTPGYPLLIYSSMMISSKYFVLITILIQILLIVFISFYVFKNQFLLKTHIIAAIFILLDPRVIISEFAILSESFYIFCASMGFLMIYKGLKIDDRNFLFSGFILFSLSVYIRPVAIFLTPLFALYLLVLKKIDLKRLALVIFIHIILLSCWMTRNYIKTDQFIFTNVGSKNLYYYTAAAIEAKVQGKRYEDVKAEFERKMAKIGEKEKIKLEKKQAMKIILKNPIVSFEVLSKGLLVNVLSPGSELFPQLLGMRKGGSGIVYKFNNMRFMEFISYLLKEEKVLLFSVFPGLIWNLFLLFFFFKNIIKDKKDLLTQMGMVFYFYHLILTAGPATTSRFTAPVVPVMIVIAFRRSLADPEIRHTKSSLTPCEK